MTVAYFQRVALLLQTASAKDVYLAVNAVNAEVIKVMKTDKDRSVAFL